MPAAELLGEPEERAVETQAGFELWFSVDDLSDVCFGGGHERFGRLVGLSGLDWLVGGGELIVGHR